MNQSIQQESIAQLLQIKEEHKAQLKTIKEDKETLESKLNSLQSGNSQELNKLKEELDSFRISNENLQEQLAKSHESKNYSLVIKLKLIKIN
jgi:predicted nuclease with TOPRIM domain